MYIPSVLCGYRLDIHNHVVPRWVTHAHIYKGNVRIIPGRSCFLRYPYALAYCHTKLVSREDNSNKKILMYIPCVSCTHKIFETITCKLKKSLKWGYHSSNRLNMSTPSRENPSSEVAIRTSEWGISHRRVGPLSGGNPISGVRLTVTSEWGNPINGAVTSAGPAGTWNRGVTHWRIGCVNSEWVKSQQRSGDPDLLVGGIPSAELNLRVENFHQRSRVHSCFQANEIPSAEPWPQ